MQRPLVFVARSYLQDTMRYIAVRNSNTGTSLVTYCIATLGLVGFISNYQILNFFISLNLGLLLITDILFSILKGLP